MNDFSAQQGWQCPICKTVYSPFTPMCCYCGQAGMTKTTTGTGTADIDWQKQQSVTTSDLVFNAGGHLYGVMGGDKIMEEFEKDKNVRWTDKVYLDSQGNLQSMDGCPTDRAREEAENENS